MANNVYLDINGDVIDEIFNLEPKNNIDKILQEIVDGGRVDVKPKKPKKSTKSKTKKDSVKVIKIHRIK